MRTKKPNSVVWQRKDSKVLDCSPLFFFSCGREVGFVHTIPSYQAPASAICWDACLYLCAHNSQERYAGQPFLRSISPLTMFRLIMYCCRYFLSGTLSCILFILCEDSCYGNFLYSHYLCELSFRV